MNWWIVLVAAIGPLAVPGVTTPAYADSIDADIKTLVRGNTEFAFDLYHQLRGEPGDLCLSPYSISTALAMTYGGARGNTERQMADVLHFTLDQDRLHPAFAALAGLTATNSDESPYRLNVANALWGQQGERFLESFLALNRRHYEAGLRELDFAGAPDQSRKVINTWVAEKTEQMIPKLLKPPDILPSTALVLTNAIYFKGNWASQFDPAKTREGTFQLTRDESIRVPMMHQLGEFAYASNETASLLELPYDGDRLSMILLLPKMAGGLQSLESSLRVDTVDRWISDLSKQPVNVMLPRFTLDTRFNLRDALVKMGMTEAFGAGADFSGMTSGGGLFIDKVIHQARVEVNEEGTEASAATAVIMKRGRIAQFHADRPFLFLIRDRVTDSVLFLGRVADPRESKEG
jgi:serpin B